MCYVFLSRLNIVFFSLLLCLPTLVFSEPVEHLSPNGTVLSDFTLFPEDALTGVHKFIGTDSLQVKETYAILILAGDTWVCNTLTGFKIPCSLFS